MARLLIVYGTTDGHTRKIAETMGRVLFDLGHYADVVDACDCGPWHDPRRYDAVVVAASVHAGSYQREARRWIRRHVTELNGMASAFVSVCLGVLEGSPETRREVQGIMSRFLMSCGWRPTATRTVAGALRWTRYGPLKKRIMLRIVRRAGGDTDTSRDIEYTDWGELALFAREIAGWLAPVNERELLTAATWTTGGGI
jgi:menaquinone-dependent protoporphyrinogen oxidase